MSNKRLKSFTLVELLVVIAIIGILAGIVIVALVSAKNKAKDARIKTDLAQIRRLGESWNNDHDSYGGFCDKETSGGFKNEDLNTLAIDIRLNGGSGPECNSSSKAYAASSNLNIGNGSWCIDSAGSALNGFALNTSCVSSASLGNTQPGNLSYFYILQGNANLSSAQIDFLVTHYNYLLIKGWLNSGLVDNLKQKAAGKNPNFKVLKYTDGMFSLAYKPPADSKAYAYNQNSTDSFKKVKEIQYNQGWYLMDPCSQDWRDYFITKARSEVIQYHVDGIMIDDMGIASGLHNVKRIDGFPQNRATNTDYSDNQWYQCSSQFLAQVKNQLAGTVIFNGLYHNAPQYDRDFLAVTDGGIREGWITADYVNFLDETKWKQLLDASIKDLENYGSSFIPLCVITNPNATVDNALFCFTSFLLTNKNDKVIYGPPTGPNGLTNLYYRPELSIDIGLPTQTASDLEGYKDPNNPNLYKRDFSGGKVIVNPTTNPMTYNLDKEYYLVIPSGSGLVRADGTVEAKLDYQAVANVITIGPQTGVVLTF